MELENNTKRLLIATSNEKWLIAFKGVEESSNLYKVRQLSSVKSAILSDNGLHFAGRPDNLNLKKRWLRELRPGQMINWEAAWRILFALFSEHRLNRMWRVFFRRGSWGAITRVFSRVIDLRPAAQGNTGAVEPVSHHPTLGNGVFMDNGIHTNKPVSTRA